MRTLATTCCALLTLAVHAAVEPGTGRTLESPAIKRAAMRPARARVVKQRIEGGEVVSEMDDGTTVREPLKLASTARAPDAIARLRIERAVARILAALGDSAKPEKQADAIEKQADAIEKLADKIEKEAGKK